MATFALKPVLPWDKQIKPPRRIKPLAIIFFEGFFLHFSELESSFCCPYKPLLELEAAARSEGPAFIMASSSRGTYIQDKIPLQSCWEKNTCPNDHP